MPSQKQEQHDSELVGQSPGTRWLRFALNCEQAPPVNSLNLSAHRPTYWGGWGWVGGGRGGKGGRGQGRIFLSRQPIAPIATPTLRRFPN